MKILGIDSSGMVAGAAIVDEEITIAEYNINYKKTHSETLLPMIDEIMKMTNSKLEEFDAIAVAAGPGSFTGLRIGSATAKGLAMAIDKPIVAVPTCHALAYNMWGTKGLVCPIMDARRNQVYTGLYKVDEGNLEVVLEQTALDIHELIDILNSKNETITFLGDGVPVFSKCIDEELKPSHQYAPMSLNRQRAASVAALGLSMLKAGQCENADLHSPIYLRKSQAEREREEKLLTEGKNE